MFACSDDDATSAPCVDGDALCGTTCGPDTPCGTGLYCTGGVCAKQCVSTELAFNCEDLSTCLPNGRCSGSLDGGTGGDGDGTGGFSDVCADTTVTARQVTPNVLLIIDQSGSMTEDFGSGDRWNVLRDFLLADPDGLIADLQSQVRFGLALYSARNQGGDQNDVPDGECPLVELTAPALDNYAAIAATYSGADPIQDTPTGDSINKIIDDLMLNDIAPDAEDDPWVFILATDGNPDRCELLQGHDDVSQQETVDAVTRAYDLGVRTFIISVGDQVSADHQQDVANAGLGRAAGDADAEYWVAGDDQSLRTALRGIVQGQLSCEVELNGSVPGDGCDGTVTLSGEALPCDDPDGWELVDPRHIQLNGQACEDLKSTDNAFLDVRFPCDVEIVF